VRCLLFYRFWGYQNIYLTIFCSIAEVQQVVVGSDLRVDVANSLLFTLTSKNRNITLRCATTEERDTILSKLRFVEHCVRVVGLLLLFFVWFQ
jgi:hypothetical protein